VTELEARVDKEGRVLIPYKFRNQLNIMPGTSVEVSIKDEAIFVTNPKQKCSLCNETENLKKFDTKHICERCIKKLKSKFMEE
jgi:transcriptional pleiotropic regulator of transition state genes